MLTVDNLRTLASQAAWIRGLGYVRNGRVRFMDSGLTDPVVPTVVSSAPADCEGLPSPIGQDGFSVPTGQEGLSVSAIVNASDRFLVKLFLTEDKPPLADCSCPHREPGLCRHAVAVCLAYLHLASDPDVHPLLVIEPDRVPMQKTTLALAHPQVNILLHWHPLTEQIRVIPRLIWLDGEGRKVLRTHPLAPGPVHRRHDDTSKSTLVRKHPATNEVIAFFGQWPQWVPDETGCLALPGEFGLYALFHDIAPLFPADWTVLYDEELEKRRPHRMMVTVKMKMQDLRQSGMLLFSASYHCDRLNITPEQLNALIQGQQMWLIDQGRYIEIENLEQIRKLLNIVGEGRQTDPDGDVLSMEAWRAAELAEWADMQRAGAVHFDSAISRLVHEVHRSRSSIDSDPNDPMPVLPERLLPILRPYQMEGVRWLHFLRTYGMGGILADDMGLGKTLQVLAFLASHSHERPSLIICPKTLIINWLHEAKRFVPELKTILIHGSGGSRKHQFRQAADCDLIVTSYPVFQRDLDQFLGMRLDTCILDEAQMIKNPDTRLTRQIKRVKADHRLVLTGTPMENTPVDLWSLFDFVMPGFLGSEAAFRLRHIVPASSSDELVRRIRPFLLRRTKADVLPELPAKLEETLYAELTQNQLAIYQHTLKHIKGRMQETMSTNRFGQAKIEFLAGLTRLRQICNHPGVVYPQYRSGAGLSGKMDLFELLLDQSLASNHKLLVFSQFTQTLSMIAEKLDHRKLRYALLDGQTSSRQAVVDQFNRDDRISVFLISLKAGGYGLNLTSADTVILFDPWWNPMVEDQAADRAHRMGQSRPVTVYRLITKGTLEEKMVQLQQRKRERFEALVNGAGMRDEAFSMEDLQYLLDESD